MNKEKQEYIFRWIAKADADLLAAEKLFNIEPEKLLSQIGFHCQQAIEKYLKAYLIFKDTEFAKTHDLNNLRDLCSKFDLDFDSLNFKSLIDFAVDFRYPEEEYSPDIQEMEGYITIAKMTKNLINNKIKFI
jgi:HEPN domain-containing protein